MPQQPAVTLTSEERTTLETFVHRCMKLSRVVDTVITFYCQHLDFHKEMHPAPIFATLSRGDLRHLLNAPSQAGSGRQTKLASLARPLAKASL